MIDLLARSRAHLHAIARAPRPAGSAADTAARRYAAQVLEGLGFTTSEHPFDYSAFPGRYGTPLFGVTGIVLGIASVLLGRAGSPAAALALLAGAGVALGVAGTWLARRGVLHMPAMRASGINLAARRGAEEPRVWLVAHTDSKSQPVPQGVRAAGIVLLMASLAGAAAVAAAQLTGWVSPDTALWWVAAAGSVVGGIPVAASIVGAGSDGALDNASGVAAVLLAAELLSPGAPVGVVITAAEEMGLAGARAWAADAAPGQIALNCDGVDDVGTLTAMYSGARPDVVMRALGEAAATCGHRYRAMRLVPGLLVDSVALADAGWQAATLSRGTVATLTRVHTERDSLAHLDGTGIPEAAAVLAGAAQRLTQGAG